MYVEHNCVMLFFGPDVDDAPFRRPHRREYSNGHAVLAGGRRRSHNLQQRRITLLQPAVHPFCRHDADYCDV